MNNFGSILARRNRPVRNSEIEALRTELELLNRSMEEADGSIKDEHVKAYASQMREVANLIEDVLDEYDLRSGDQTGVIIGKLRSRNNLSGDAKRIKDLLAKVRETRVQYDIRDRVSAETETVDYRLFVTPMSEDDPLVGADMAVKDLTAVLLDGGGKRRSAVVVLGGGGIGKSTLARRVFASEAAKERFQIRAWVEVPQGRIVVEEILSRTASQVLGQKFDNGTTKEELVEALKGKRYLIVFDDVWKEQLWRVTRDFLPDNGVGSKVMITTRHETVADSFVKTASDFVYRAKRLSERSAWDLFCSIAFRRSFGGETGCPEELRERSAEIVEMCEGVPLVIRAVAGLVLRKFGQPRELKKLLQSFSLENPSLAGPSKIMARSFDDLPQHLRKCFMYFSIFPKESLIRVENLVKFWVAEGFVQQRQGEAIEEGAEEYLNDLVDGNLVEACEGFHGIDRFCRVHNLMHEIVRKKASDRDFCMFSDGESSSSRGKSRRVVCSSAEGVAGVLNAVEGYHIRSVFLWNTGPLTDSILVKLFKRYYLLTMLDIENSGLEVLPREVGYLLCLNYLSVKNTKVRKLPKTVRKLSKLEVLDLSGSLLAELPMEIAKLGNLRHLLASRGDNDRAALGFAKGVKIKEGIGALANLQTLATVDATHSGVDVIQEMKKLKQLRSLRVSRLTCNLAYALCPCITEMKLLESLHLEALKNETLDLQTVLIPPPRLESLVLKGELRRLPDWISRLGSIRIICLSLSSLEYDPLNRFNHLLELESLLLYGAYRGPRLSFKDGFRKLKLLVLREMPGLEEVEIEDDAMPLLEELKIGPSPLLEGLPAGISRLSCLKVLSFYDMPNEFVLRVSKVQLVPTLLFWYKNATGSGYVSHRPGELDLWRRLSYGDSNADTAGVCQDDIWPSFSNREDEGDSDSVGSLSDSESIADTASPSSVPLKKVRRRFSWSDVEDQPTMFKKLRRTSLTSDVQSVYSDDVED